MKGHPSLTAAVAALLFGSTFIPAAPAAAEGGPTADGTGALAAQPGTNVQTVPLITGDTAVLSPDGTVDVRFDDGIGFSIHTARTPAGTDTYVIPRDARAPIAAGTLDRDLFNVSGLARDGRTGASPLPLIVRDLDGTIRMPGARSLPGIDATALEVSTEDAAAVWNRITADDDASVWLDGRSRLLLDTSVPQIGAPRAWESGYTGEGVTVAVLDGGYDPAHPDLAGPVTEARDFTGTSPEALDGFGHGTHVASTVAGSGAASGGAYRGVAPDVDLLIGKVCTDDGWCQNSDVIAGMQWAADSGADIVNLSLGGGPTDGTDPLSTAVNELRASTGTLFVIAAGNDGCAECVGTPATADAALAVGSVTKSDELSDFSNLGPRYGDHAVKPDITAPGTDITAARAEGTGMDRPVDEHYTMADGTSMATPHVAGAAALLKQAHPDWDAERLKAVLMGSSKGLDDLTVYQQGSGRLDVAAATSTVVVPDVGSLSFGGFENPHDQAPVAKSVTYTNLGDADVTLDLAVNGDTADMFTVDKTTVAVPAGAPPRPW